ncbi:20741_t:CDS:2 [Gigaspora rosea]|nr:20741_t:CDS:2 [Gigaspora rosea]
MINSSNFYNFMPPLSISLSKFDTKVYVIMQIRVSKSKGGQPKESYLMTNCSSSKIWEEKFLRYLELVVILAMSYFDSSSTSGGNDDCDSWNRPLGT